MEENCLLYCQQRNNSVSFLWQIKKSYYENLDGKGILDNQKFWKTAKPRLPDKSVNSGNIHINEKGGLIKSETKTAEALNNFFSNIVKNLEFLSIGILIQILKILKTQFLKLI